MRADRVGSRPLSNMTTLSSVLKRRALSIASGVTNRHAVLLPAQSSNDRHILAANAPYRISADSAVTIDLHEPGPGTLTASLIGYQGHFPVRHLWSGTPLDYDGPTHLRFSPNDGAVYLGLREWGHVSVPLPGRRFVWRIRLQDAAGRVCWRDTGHYVAVNGRDVDASYYNGDDYVEYDLQAESQTLIIRDLLRRYNATGPLLEIGCATGCVLGALESIANPCYGLDYSEWAILTAERRLGPGRVWKCDVENEILPEELAQKAPFRVCLLWAVLEHFYDPGVVLRNLTKFSATDALLFINTTNTNSLSHQLFGPDWEGYYDWTHHAVDLIGVDWLRRELPKLGWSIVHLSTDHFWDSSPDPSHSTLRELWSADSRFRRLLVERELGDFVTCVARRI
jgi:2-polyprenyl-3-methyl-5-hydroxy-6-metoxy-1,4-benzoquinol methylase